MPSSIAIDNPYTTAQSDVGEAEGQGHPADHKWDDILRAIDEDLRAFWGLWNTVIVPRLDPNIPTERAGMREWDGNDVDIATVWLRMDTLQAKVKTLMAHRRMKPEEQRSWGCLERLVTSVYPDKSKKCFRSFAMRIIGFQEMVPYPMPVN